MGPVERRAIAQRVIDRIVKRTQTEFKDKKGKDLPGYSDSYIKSKKFEFAGKNENQVNLTLSNEMLNSIVLLSDKKGEITIGFEKGDLENNGKAEGNIKGTYGRKNPIRGKKRDFLGIQRNDLKDIQDEFDVSRNEKAKENLERIKDLLDV
jgi:hypothetical protein